MPERTKNSSLNKILSIGENNIVPIALIVVILFMFIPVNKVVIDALMVLNLALSFIILLTALNVKYAPDFSTYPRVVLMITIFGLAINISSTRNILFHPVTGSDLSSMAGQSEMVKAFAKIVAGDSIVIGLIIFIILIVVQVFVITKGADRVSEVKARFTLDAMNNKLMKVQADLSNGYITEEEAKAQSESINRGIDFYSAMDGATKFVSNNVKIGILITLINLIGGIVTGMMGSSLSFKEAFDAYSKLTIGDGLMSQLPSLLVSFSTGLLVTANSSDSYFSEDLKKNFSTDGYIYIIVGSTFAVLSIAFHNAASITLLFGAALFIYNGIRLTNVKKKQKVEEAKKAEEAKTKTVANKGPAEVSPITKVDELSLCIGYSLVPLAKEENGGELVERVKRIRKEIALDLGLVVPPIRIQDEMALDAESYVFKIRGVEFARGKVKSGYYMCINTGSVLKEDEIIGEETFDPTFHMKAIWVPESKRIEAERVGYAVIDAPTIIATHLTEEIRRNASQILNRQAVSAIIDKIKETNNVVVEEVVSGDARFTYGEIEAVLKNLLSEQVSIRNMVTILETLADYGRMTKDPWILTEKVREALGKQICLQYVTENEQEERILHVLTLSQSLAQKVLDNRSDVPGKKPMVAFGPVDARNYIKAMANSITAVEEMNYIPIVLCPDEVRLLVKSSIERELPGVVCLSISEVMAAGSSIKIESLGDINE